MKPSTAIALFFLLLMPSCVTRATAGRMAVAGYYAGRIDEAAAVQKVAKDPFTVDRPAILDTMLELDRMTYANQFDALMGLQWADVRAKVVAGIAAAKAANSK